MRFKSVMFVFFLGALFSTHAADITRGDIATMGGSSVVMTINQSGIYPLTDNYTGQILVTASNVTLDMQGFKITGGTYGVRITGNNCTVQNGTVTGAQVGVRIESNNNDIINLDLVANGTGLQIVSGNNNVVDNCRALQNTSAGFSLSTAQNNMFVNCSAIGNGSDAYAYGFISQDGTGNTFENCIAENTATTGSSPFYAAGFLLTQAEWSSQINNSKSLNASGQLTYGMRLLPVTISGCTPSLSLLPSGTVNLGNTIFDLSWLTVGSSYYVAAVGGPVTGPEIIVAQFNPTTGILSLITSATKEYGGVNTHSADWLTLNGSYYLAVGGDDNMVHIYQFFPSTGALNTLPNATYDVGATVLEVNWQQINGIAYLGVGGGTAPNIRILQFNPVTTLLTSIPGATYTYGGGEFAMAWLQIGTSYYLGITGSGIAVNPKVLVFNFDYTAGTLDLIPGATFTPSPNSDFYAVDWLTIGSSYYLSVGFSTLSVLQFNPVAGTLNSVATNVGSWAATQNKWVTVGQSYYLAIGSFNNGAVAGTINTAVFQFNPAASTLTLLSACTYRYNVGATTPYVYSVNWLAIRSTRYLTIGGAAGASDPALVQMFNFDDCQRIPQYNMIKSNQASGNVIGVRDDYAFTSSASTNLWMGNLGNNNTTNFNIGSQYPISAASGTGVGQTENMDAALTTGGPAEKIMATVVDQTASFNTLYNTYVRCYPTIITAATTISSGGYYALGNLVNGTVAISGATNVSLDLAGRRVQSVVVQNSSRVAVVNGYIVGTGLTEALNINASTNVRLQDLFVTGATYGLHAQGLSSNIFANNCFFNSNLTTGAFVENGRGNEFTFCTANKNGTNGFVLTGTGHTITSSQANRNTLGAGFQVAGNSSSNEIRSCSACANTYGYDMALTTSNLIINNFAYVNTTTDYNPPGSTRWGFETVATNTQWNYCSNINV